MQVRNVEATVGIEPTYGALQAMCKTV